MLREQNKLILNAHRLLDIILTAAAFIAAYFIKRDCFPAQFKGLTHSPNYWIVLLLVIIIWYISFSFFDVYAPYRKRTFRHILWNMVKAVSTGMVAMFFCMFLFKMNDVSRIMMGLFYLLNISLFAVSKGAAYWILFYCREKGFNFRNILVIGSKARAKEIIGTIKKNQGAGYNIIGCLELDEKEVGKEVYGNIKVIGRFDQLVEILWEEVVDELIFAMPLNEIENVDEYITSAETLGVAVRIIPDWQIHCLANRPNFTSIHFESFLGAPTINIRSTRIAYTRSSSFCL